MEWLSWAAVKELLSNLFLFGLFWALISCPFLAVQIWKLNRRLDRLGLLEVWAAHQEKKKEKPLPPADFRETMAKHEQAAKRMTEGLGQ